MCPGPSGARVVRAGGQFALGNLGPLSRRFGGEVLFCDPLVRLLTQLSGFLLVAAALFGHGALALGELLLHFLFTGLAVRGFLAGGFLGFCAPA